MSCLKRERVAAWVLRLAIGGVFVYAAWRKLTEPWILFAAAIEGYRIVTGWAAIVVARALPWAELLLGAALIAGVRLKWAAAAAALLMSGFIGLMLYAYLRGMNIACGCFGSTEQLGPATLIRDGLLWAGSLALFGLAVRLDKLRAYRAAATGADGIVSPSTNRS